MEAKGIELINTGTGKVKEFEKKHAENLLKYQAEKGYSHWALVSDKLKFEDGHIVRRSNPGTAKKPKK